MIRHSTIVSKLTSLSSKEEEKKKQKPTRNVGRKKGGDPALKRHG